MKHCILLLSLFSLVLSASSLRADQLTVLNSADTFAVLASSTITSADSSQIVGDMGLFPGTSITGFPPGSISGGAIHIGDSPSIAAYTAASSAYSYLAGLAPTQNLTGQDLGGLTLAPGVYLFNATAQLTGFLTLDFQHQDDANIVIQVGSTFNTAANSTITVINQGRNDNVYYQVGSSATLGTGSVLQGDILASASISLDAEAAIGCGGVMALNGAVTLIGNSIHNCSTTGSDVTLAGRRHGPPINPVPEPCTLSLLATGLLGTAFALRPRLITSKPSKDIQD